MWLLKPQNHKRKEILKEPNEHNSILCDIERPPNNVLSIVKGGQQKSHHFFFKSRVIKV